MNLVVGADLRLAPPRLFQPLHPFGDRQNSFHPRLIEHSLGVGICFLDASACAFTKRLLTAPYSTALQGLVRGAAFIAPAISIRLATYRGIV